MEVQLIGKWKARNAQCMLKFGQVFGLLCAKIGPVVAGTGEGQIGVELGEWAACAVRKKKDGRAW